MEIAFISVFRLELIHANYTQSTMYGKKVSRLFYQKYKKEPRITCCTQNVEFLDISGYLYIEKLIFKVMCELFLKSERVKKEGT